MNYQFFIESSLEKKIFLKILQITSSKEGPSSTFKPHRHESYWPWEPSGNPTPRHMPTAGNILQAQPKFTSPCFIFTNDYLSLRNIYYQMLFVYLIFFSLLFFLFLFLILNFKKVLVIILFSKQRKKYFKWDIWKIGNW